MRYVAQGFNLVGTTAVKTRWDLLVILSQVSHSQLIYSTYVLTVVCGRVAGAFPWPARVDAQFPGASCRHSWFLPGRPADGRVALPDLLAAV